MDNIAAAQCVVQRYLEDVPAQLEFTASTLVPEKRPAAKLSLEPDSSKLRARFNLSAIAPQLSLLCTYAVMWMTPQSSEMVVQNTNAPLGLWSKTGIKNFSVPFFKEA